MKTTVSGSGVKAANRFQIVSKIEGKYWSTYRIDRMKSADLLLYWNYKAEGLTLDVAKKELIDTISIREKLASKKSIGFYEYRGGYKDKYLSKLEEKKKSIDSFLKTCEKLDPSYCAYRYSYGNYKYQHRTFLLTTKTPYPVTLTVSWSEDHDWNYYAKSYGRPKSTYSDRMVVFKTIGKLGKVETIFTYSLTSFAGNFIEKAIAAYFKVGKVKCSNELKSIQLSDFFSLKETNAINGYRLFERHIGPLLWDYAILDTKTKETYHAFEQDKLVPGLRNKLQAKLDHEFETINKATGFALGFCETGMRNFCADNNLDFDGEYSRRYLRNIVIQKREINYRKYRSELAKICINLGK